jgi:hypothetical protein
VKSGRSIPTFQAKLLSSSSRYMMEAAGSTEMPVHLYQIIQHHISKGSNIHDVFFIQHVLGVPVRDCMILNLSSYNNAAFQEWHVSMNFQQPQLILLTRTCNIYKNILIYLRNTSTQKLFAKNKNKQQVLREIYVVL